MVGVLDVGQQVAASPDQVESSSQQVAGGAHLGRVDVGLGEVSATQQCSDLEGIDLVVLRFAAVDGLHVEGVSENELDAFASAQVGQPVPGEHALDGDDEIVAERHDGLQEGLRSALDVPVEQDLAVLIEDTEVHGLRMQVDSAVVLVVLSVESHRSLLKRLGVCVFQPGYSGWSSRRRGPE